MTSPPAAYWFEPEDLEVRARLPGALGVLLTLATWGAPLGRVGAGLGVGTVVVGLLLAFSGLGSDVERWGCLAVLAGMVLVPEGLIIVGAARRLENALSGAGQRVRPQLWLITLAGLPFALGALTFAGMVLARGPRLRVLGLVGTTALAGAGLPAVACYALIRYRVVWAAMDAEVVRAHRSGGA